jgi:hypothetical protein
MHAFAAALTVVLLTGPGSETDEPLTSAVAAAARESLGTDGRVVVRRVTAFPSDDEAAALGNDLRADAVAELTWLGADNPKAAIHLFRSKPGRWVDRELGFKPADAPGERGRTVGFTIASMVPERPEEPTAPPRVERIEPPGRPRAVETPSAPELPSKSGARFMVWLDAMGIAGLGVRDSGGGLGGLLDVRVRLAPSVAWRLGAAFRTSRVVAADATSMFFSGGTGIGWTALATRDARGSVGLRLDGLLIRQEFAHLSNDDATTVHEGKWLPGADLLIEAAWYFSTGAGLAAGAGAEAAFGRTDLVVRGQRVTTLQPVRPVLELGLRLRF